MLPDERRSGDALAVDKDATWIEQRIGQPWRQGNAIFIDGRTIPLGNIDKIRITATVRSTRHARLDALVTPGNAAPEDHEVAIAGQDVTDQFITGAPGSAPTTAEGAPTSRITNRKAVMVIYGHDHEANTALFNWLRAVGLLPGEWSQLLQASGSASPYIGDVLEHAFNNAQAVIAMFTPDEYVTTRNASPDHDNTWRLQARPNVLIEAGMALITHPKRTVLVLLGTQELPTDLAGRSYIRISSTSAQPLHDLAGRLQAAGCELDLSGSQWLDPANFPNRDHITPPGTTQRPAQNEIQNGRPDPITHEHRDRMRDIASRAAGMVRSENTCQYIDSRHPNSGSHAKEMIAGHFPDTVALLDDWNLAVAERETADAELSRTIDTVIADNMSRPPWNPEPIRRSFREHIDACAQIAGSGTREPDLEFYDTQPAVMWSRGGGRSVLIFTKQNTADDEHYKAQFRTWFDSIRASVEFERLRKSWSTIRNMKNDILSAVQNIEQKEEIYGTCKSCQP